MKLPEIRDAVRIELQDLDSSMFSDGELDKAVERTVSIMSRLIPDRAVVEIVVPKEVTDETLTVSDGSGQLATYPVRNGTLTIRNTVTGTASVENTDYFVNYITGEVTGVAHDTGTGYAYTATYTPSDSYINISNLVSKIIKIEKVEYPMGTYPAFEHLGELLKLKEESLSQNDKLRITYITPYIPPTVIEDGSYPLHLDAAVIIGASAKALISKARKYLFKALSESEDSETAAGNAKEAIDGATAALNNVGDCITAAEGYLGDADSYANTVTAGEDPATAYTRMADGEISAIRV